MDWRGGLGQLGRLGRRLRPGRRAVKWSLITVTAMLLVPTASAGIALRVSYSGDPADGTRTRDRDAIWLGHAWLDGRRDDTDLALLKRRVAGTGIRDLYVHAGPLEHDGTLRADRYPRARWLLRAVREELPGIRVQAWLGDNLVYDDGGGGLRLSDPAARRAVVASARQILDVGFAGVHFDLEPLHSGNRDYLRLLDKLRPAVHRKGGLLSVAAHQIDPLPAAHTVLGTLTGRPKWWSQEYFGEVARRVDQIAVMSYDTAMPVQSLYGGYVAQQTVLALEVAPPEVDLLMGLPFFHTDDLGHRASAETVPAAVRGVRLGLSREDADRRRFGVALYVDFAATAADWKSYRDDWCGP